jgi:hypothetical protein
MKSLPKVVFAFLTYNRYHYFECALSYACQPLRHCRPTSVTKEISVRPRAVRRGFPGKPKRLLRPADSTSIATSTRVMLVQVQNHLLPLRKKSTTAFEVASDQ